MKRSYNQTFPQHRRSHASFYFPHPRTPVSPRLPSAVPHPPSAACGRLPTSADPPAAAAAVSLAQPVADLVLSARGGPPFPRRHAVALPPPSADRPMPATTAGAIGPSIRGGKCPDGRVRGGRCMRWRTVRFSWSGVIRPTSPRNGSGPTRSVWRPTKPVPMPWVRPGPVRPCWAVCCTVAGVVGGCWSATAARPTPYATVGSVRPLITGSLCAKVWRVKGWTSCSAPRC